MVERGRSRISMDSAVGWVGRAIYDADWIGELTERERWLIERYVDGSSKPQSSSIITGQITYVVAGRSWAEMPADPALIAEIERALDRRDWHKAQCECVFDWLESRGFNLDAQWIYREALAREMAKDFASKMTESKPSTAKLTNKSAQKPSTAKHVTNKSAQKLANEYITEVKSSGRNPTAAGLVRYARDRDLQGGRDLLRTAFKNVLGDEFKGPGRPRKNSPK